MQEVEVRPREAAAAAATISLTAPAAARGSRGSSGDSSELEPTASGSVTSGGSSGGADESPMDLSSGGATTAVSALPGGMAMPITPSTLMHNAGLVRLDEDHPLLNARKLNARMLAEFVKAQHLAQRQKANETTPPSAAAAAAAEIVASRMHHPKKRPYTPLPEDAFVDARSGLIPLDLLRAKLELQQERRSPDSGETERNSSNSSTPSIASSIANNVVSNGNNNATTMPSGREVKKRRLDALLNRKFAVADSPPSEQGSSPSPRPMMLHAPSPPLPVVPMALMPTHHVGNGGGGGGVGSSRRKSSEHQPRKANRRKQSHPQSPPTLSVRPTAELFPQRPLSPSKVSATMMSSPLRPLAIPSPSPIERKTTPRQAENGGGEAEALKGQILQLQLMQAALLSASAANPTASDLLKTALGGAATGQQQSLLHYGYFAQMLQNLQSQQTKLVEQLVAGKAGGGGGAPKAEPDLPLLPGGFKFPPTTESILREPPRNHQVRIISEIIGAGVQFSRHEFLQICQEESRTAHCPINATRRKEGRVKGEMCLSVTLLDGGVRCVR